MAQLSQSINITIFKEDNCSVVHVSGKIDVELMVTHNFTLEETPEAFDIVEAYKDGAIKAMINL